MAVTALKKVISQNSLTITDLAHNCQISSTYLSMIVNGHRSNVSEEILEALALQLKLSRNEVDTLIKTPYKVKQNKTHEQYGKCSLYLNNVLNALEVNNLMEIDHYVGLLIKYRNSILLARKFSEWYKGWQLTLNNCFQEALELFNSAKDFKPRTEIERRFMAKIQSSIGGACVAKGNYKTAMESFRKSLYLWDSGKQVALVYLNMGTLYRRNNKYTLSLNAYEKAIEYGTSDVKLRAISSLAQIAFDKDNIPMARRYLLQGYMMAKSEPDHRGKDDLYCNIGVYFSITRKYERAKKWLQKSIIITNHTHNTRTRHFAIAELIDLYLRTENVLKVNELIYEVENQLSENSDTLLLASYLCIIAKRHFNCKEYEKSYFILDRCYRLLKNIPPSHELITCCTLLKQYHLYIREPYIADFYVNEVKLIKNKIG